MHTLPHLVSHGLGPLLAVDASACGPLLGHPHHLRVHVSPHLLDGGVLTAQQQIHAAAIAAVVHGGVAAGRASHQLDRAAAVAARRRARLDDFCKGCRGVSGCV